MFYHCFGITKRSAIFTQQRSQEGENYGVIYAGAEYYFLLSAKHSFSSPEPLCLTCNRPRDQETTIEIKSNTLDNSAHEQTIICRSSGRLSANEKEEKVASNDTFYYQHHHNHNRS